MATGHQEISFPAPDIWRDAFIVLAALQLAEIRCLPDQAAAVITPEDVKVSTQWFTLIGNSLHERVTFLLQQLGVVREEVPALLGLLNSRWKSNLANGGELTRKSIIDAILLARTQADVQTYKELEPVLQVLGLPPPALKSTDGACQLSRHLLQWLKRIRSKAFMTLRAPGQSSVQRLDDVYVELVAARSEDIPRENILNADRNRSQYFALLTRNISLSPEQILQRAVSRVILVGEPGAGKSTVVKRLVQQIARGEVNGISLPLPVELGPFAAYLERHPQASLATYFLHGTLHCPPQAELQDALEKCIVESTGVIWLLDGWDEVPVSWRPAVRDAIERDTAGVRTLLTSRPSGVPDQFRTFSTQFYELSRMGPDGIHRFVTSYLGRNKSSKALIDLIERDGKLKEVGGNPSILALICEQWKGPKNWLHERMAFAEADTATVASVYFELIDGLVNNGGRAGGKRIELTEALLAKISHFAGSTLITHNNTPARYTFTQAELAAALGSPSKCKAVLATRLMDRVGMKTGSSSPSDLYEFVHASLHEALAGKHAIHERTAAVHLMTRVLMDEQVVEVAGFFAVKAESDSANLFWDILGQRFDHPDLFLIMDMRLARLLSIAGTPNESAARLKAKLEKRLWGRLHEKASEALATHIVRAFLGLDGHRLVQFCEEDPSKPVRIARNVIASYVPTHLRTARFIEVIEEWGASGYLVPRIPAPDEVPELINRYRTTKDEDAARDLGRSRNSAVIPVLRPELFREKPTAAAVALLQMNLPEAMHTVIDAYLWRGCHGQYRSDALGFNIQPFLRELLDATGRDRILRILAVLPPQRLDRLLLLQMLEGHPLGTGGHLLLALFDELKSDAAVLEATRDQMAAVLCASGEHFLLAEGVERMGREPSRSVRHTLGRAVRLGYLPPFAWIRQQLEPARFDLKLIEAFLEGLNVCLSRFPGNKDVARLLDEVFDVAWAQIQKIIMSCGSLPIGSTLANVTFQIAVGRGYANKLLELVEAASVKEAAELQQFADVAAGVLAQDEKFAKLLVRRLEKLFPIPPENRQSHEAHLLRMTCHAIAKYHPELLVPWMGEPDVLDELRSAALSRRMLIFADGRTVLASGMDPNGVHSHTQDFSSEISARLNDWSSVGQTTPPAQHFLSIKGDFLIWNGQEYQFSGDQVKVIRMLYHAALTSNPVVPSEKIKKVLGVKRLNLSATFRLKGGHGAGPHPAWNTIIKQQGDGYLLKK